MFTPQQIAELSAKLSPDHVKTRKQSGRSLSYIEGWHAIAEANRIFGYHGWTRETIEARCVNEGKRSIGENRVEGFGVSYVAKVRVTVTAGDRVIVREGYGTGHGIDRDAGQAHESAIKEAETDAMKRALMTFGNPFGLALYDKTQAMVGDDEPAPPAPKPLPKAGARDVYKRLQDTLRTVKDIDGLQAWGADNSADINSLPEDWKASIRKEWLTMRDEFAPARNLMAAG